MTTLSCFLFQCRIVQDYVIPKVADDMETALTHKRYESFLGKECVCNHRSGYALYLVFFADMIVAIQSTRFLPILSKVLQFGV